MKPISNVRVINFSGGQSSALMTILLEPTPDDIVLFTDTGREHPKTYKFINDFEAFEGIKIHRATYTHEKSAGLSGFDALVNRKNFLPNRAKRLCTENLKIATAKTYLKKLGVISFQSYLGFRYDEKQRVNKYFNEFKKVVTHFPLFDLKINKPMVNDYWDHKPYKLEIPGILGNCDLCFLKGKNAIIMILQNDPSLADKWIKDEVGNRRYFPDITYRELLDISKRKLTLFDLKEITPAYSCACTV